MQRYKTSQDTKEHTALVTTVLHISAIITKLSRHSILARQFHKRTQLDYVAFVQANGYALRRRKNYLMFEAGHRWARVVKNNTR